MSKKAKYFLKDIDFSHENAHLAYTLGTGAASKLNEAILLKGEDVELTEEQEEYINKFKDQTPVLKAEMFNNTLRNMLHSKLKQEYRDGTEWVWLEDFTDSEAIFSMGDDKTFKVSYSMEGDQIKLDDQLVQVIADTRYVELKKASGEKPEQQEENEASRLDNVIEKTKEDNMTQEATNVDKIEIDKAQLDELQKSLKALEELQKAAEQKDEVIKSLQADKEARDFQEVTKACDKFVAVTEKEELAKALFAVQKAGMKAEAVTLFKAFADVQKAADEALEKEAGIESTDEESVDNEMNEVDLIKAASAELYGKGE